MTRYFFDLSDGRREPDHEGTEFADNQGAQREAIRYVGEVLKSEPDWLEHGTMRVEVRDEARAILFVVQVSLEAAPRS